MPLLLGKSERGYPAVPGPPLGAPQTEATRGDSCRDWSPSAPTCTWLMEVLRGHCQHLLGAGHPGTHRTPEKGQQDVGTRSGLPLLSLGALGPKPSRQRGCGGRSACPAGAPWARPSRTRPRGADPSPLSCLLTAPPPSQGTSAQPGPPGHRCSRSALPGARASPALPLLAQGPPAQPRLPHL